MTPSTDTSTRNRRERRVPVPDRIYDDKPAPDLEDRLRELMMADANKKPYAPKDRTGFARNKPDQLTERQELYLSVIKGKMTTGEIAKAVGDEQSSTSILHALRTKGLVDYKPIRANLNVWWRIEK